MIVCKDIYKIYSSPQKSVTALSDINLHIKTGEFVAITGQSGSGKSSLMNILGLLDTSTKGRIFIAGKDTSNLSPHALARMRSKQIGFVFQSFNLVPSLTAFENVCLPLTYRGISSKEMKRRCEEALEMTSMTDRKNHYPTELSGGQMQRVAISRAIVTNPEIILADEPTGNLDPQNSCDILALLKNFSANGKTVVVVTHDMTVAAAADRIISLSGGKIDF